MKLILLPGMDGTGELFDALSAELGVDIEPVSFGYPGSECLALRPAL